MLIHAVLFIICTKSDYVVTYITYYIFNLGISLTNPSIVFWNSSEALLTPKLSLLYHNFPMCVENTVISLLSGCNSSWLNSEFKLNLEITLAPFKILPSVQILISPCSLNTGTIGDTHGVGPLTGSIMSLSNILYKNTNTNKSTNIL